VIDSCPLGESGWAGGFQTWWRRSVEVASGLEAFKLGGGALWSWLGGHSAWGAHLEGELGA
jgi:hypothetical protein